MRSNYFKPQLCLILVPFLWHNILQNHKRCTLLSLYSNPVSLSHPTRLKLMKLLWIPKSVSVRFSILHVSLHVVCKLGQQQQGRVLCVRLCWGGIAVWAVPFNSPPISVILLSHGLLISQNTACKIKGFLIVLITKSCRRKTMSRNQKEITYNELDHFVQSHKLKVHHSQ